MNEEQKRKISKYLSLILRHKPEVINLDIDKEGWASVDYIIRNSDFSISREELNEVVYTNDKRRFSFDSSGTRIRANQGHSLKDVDLKMKSQSPPEVLYHGTVARFIESILTSGLKKMNRQHVHLSREKGTALNVGRRRGRPILLKIKSKEMEDKGYQFYLSDNGVWLTDCVPSEFIVLES